MTEVKCVVTGDACAGKSQVIIQFINKKFVKEYDPTIEDSYRNLVKVGSTDVLLDILDTAGQTEYSAVRDQYFRRADVVIILYSITNKQSFENVRQYHSQVCRVKDSTAVPFILAGTKTHKRDTRVQIIEPGASGAKKIEHFSPLTFSKGLKMAADIKAQGFFECSAKTRVGINEMFERAAEVGLQYVQTKGKDVDMETSGFHSLLLQITKSSFNLFNEILKQGMEENYDIRVMLVGRAAVGKTTLTRRLLRLPVNLKNYNSTNGVDVHIHSCDIKLDSGIWVIKKQEKSLRKKLMKLWAKRIKKHEENAEKTNITGYRDFHLRCAKLLQKIQEYDFEDLRDAAITNSTQEPSSSPSKSASDFTDNGIDTHSDESISDNSDEEDLDSENHGTLSDRCLRISDVLSKPTKSTGPIHKSVDNSDVEQTLQQAKTLPSEKATRMAKVSLYDFAGQYIFHASHPTFLSPCAIYMLVFDLNKLIEWKGKKKTKKSSHQDEEQYFGDCRGHGALGDRESIFFWLNVIYLFAALKQNVNPQVILVGTHYDKLPKAERDTLIGKFFRDLRCEIAATPLKELVSYEFVVDNSKKDDDSFSKIKSEIFRLAKLQPDWGKKTPSKWLPLERELQCLKESGLKVLSLEELTDINGGLDLRIDSDAEMEMFLQFLHDTGEIIFFSEKDLRNYIVLDPVWLIDALKLVITSDRFAVRIPKLAEKWIDFYKTGVIYRSTIVGIFEERTDDPALYENHEHVLRLMEKFLFIAAPVQFPDEESENGGADEQVTQTTRTVKSNSMLLRLVEEFLATLSDTCYVMPCMIHKEIDTQLITSVEGTCRTSVLCLVSINHFLPPATFQKLMAMCIKKWPIVAQHGQKLIFCGVCKFNLDSSRNYKLTVFQVGYAVHARIASYSREESLPHTVCGGVFDFLVQSLKSVLKGMGFADNFRTCVQCPGLSPLDNGGYIDTDIAKWQADITCDDCATSHSIQSEELLNGWMKMQSAEQSLNEDSDDEVGGGSVDDAVLDSEVSDDTDIDAVGGVPSDPVVIDDSDVGGGSLASIDNESDEADTKEDQEEDVDISVGPITQEHINQARLCNVIVTVCSDALRDILVAQVPAAYTDIYKALLGNRAVIAAMKQIGREQFQMIFPDPTFRYTGTVDQFDITLLYALIRNISSCPAPATGWGRPPTDQPRDTSLSASVERIRLIRNKVSGHSVDGKLEDQAYEDYMGGISQILDDIEVVLGDQGYKDALEERRKQIITPQEAKSLRRKFEDYRHQLKEDMLAVVETYESFKEAMDARVAQLSTAIAQNL